MKIQFTCRFENTVDEAINKIEAIENVPKSQVVNKIIQLGLEAYFKNNENSESGKREENLSPKFDEFQERIQSFSDQLKDMDLKSYRLNLFITDFAELFFEGTDKFNLLNEGVKRKLEIYKTQIKYIPKLGFITLKHMKNILKKNITDQFYTEIEEVFLAMEKKNWHQ